MSSATPAGDRWLESIRELIRDEVSAALPYSGVYDYQVITPSDGKTVNALPVDGTRGLPPVSGVPIRTGIAGGSCAPQAGTHVAIGFLDQNPTKPFVFGVFDSTGALMVQIDALTTSIGPNGIVLLGGGAAPLATAPWAFAIETALTTLGAAFEGLGGVLAPLVAIGTALVSQVDSAPPAATTKTTAT